MPSRFAPVPLFVFALSLLAAGGAAAPVSSVKATIAAKADVQGLAGRDRLPACENRTEVLEQTFRVAAPGSPHDGAIFLVTICYGGPGRLTVAEFRQGAFSQLLPAHPANEYSVDGVDAVAFRDVNGDGVFDLVTVVSASTGIGPDGAMPFPVPAVWLGSADGKFAVDEKANEALGKGGKVKTLKAAFATLKKFYGGK